MTIHSNPWRRRLGHHFAASFVLVSLGLAACSASEPEATDSDAEPSGSDVVADSEPEKLEIGVMLWNAEVSFYGRFIDAVNDAASDLDVTVNLQDGQGELTEQLAIIQRFVADEVDAIIVTPSDAEGIVPAIEIANDAGIPVLSANNRVGQGPDIVTFIGADDFEFGRRQGELLVQAVGAEAQVGLVLGALGTSAQVLREEGLRDYLTGFPDVKIVESQSANWVAEEVVVVVQDWLVRYDSGELDAIVDQGPEGVAAARVIADAGRTEVFVILGDYPAAVQQAIIDGVVYGTVNQDPYPQAYQAVEIAVALLRDGTRPPSEQFIDLPLVDINNVADIAPAWGG